MMLLTPPPRRSALALPRAAPTGGVHRVEHQPREADVDWKLYALQRKYERAGGILYKQSILRPEEYDALMNEWARQRQSTKMAEEKESSFATKRMGFRVSEDSEMHRIMSRGGGSLCRLVNDLADGDDAYGTNVDWGEMVLAEDVPMEVRKEHMECRMHILHLVR